jgi:hypothetical protein
MLSELYWARKAIIMASKDPQISKHGTAGNWKHVTLMIPQKLEITKRLESGESRSVVMASYKTGSSTMSGVKKEKDQLQFSVASYESVKGLFTQDTETFYINAIRQGGV